MVYSIVVQKTDTFGISLYSLTKSSRTSIQILRKRDAAVAAQRMQRLFILSFHDASLCSPCPCREPLGLEPFGGEPLSRELGVERLRAEPLGAERPLGRTICVII